MDAANLREVLLTALPPQKVMDLARELGVVERESVIELDELVNALVLTSRTPAGGRQADVLRAYVESTGVEPVRGTFYARFNAELESLLERLLRDSMTAALADPVLLPSVLQGVKDWWAIDSETVHLHPSLATVYPGTGDYAAVKVHKTYSIGRHNMLDYKLSPARDHDSLWFQVTESHRGYGLLMDLGYASHDRLMDCERFGVSFVIKLKTGWKARLTSVTIGEIAALFTGTDFAEALSFGQLSCENGIIDADVALNRGKYALRLVAVETPEKKLCVFLTNLPGIAILPRSSRLSTGCAGRSRRATNSTSRTSHWQTCPAGRSVLPERCSTRRCSVAASSAAWSTPTTARSRPPINRSLGGPSTRGSSPWRSPRCTRPSTPLLLAASGLAVSGTISQEN